jgi:ribA/ribD-fused uncharacterized protein
MDGRTPRGIYHALKAEGCLTEAAARDRRQILAGLKLQLQNPPGGWTLEVNERGERTGRAVPMPGGRTLYDMLLDVLWPYLNDRGKEMAHTVAAAPPVRERTTWWQFWRRAWAWLCGRPGLSLAEGTAKADVTRALTADRRILFYKRDREAFGFLSNFHPAPLVLDGETWPTAEHYYQAQKSSDPEYQRAVRAAATPGQAKRLGAAPDAPRRVSQQSWFRRNRKEPRTDWEAVKLDVMRAAVRAKFVQNRALAEWLLATGTAELVEDSATDAFWGAGADGRGLNWLGRVLAEVRAELAARWP